MYALVTGASSGIGVEIAKLLARRQYNLILVARRKKRLVRLKAQLKSKYNISVKVIECDLSKEENCYQLCKEIKDLDVSVLVNNAGFGKVGFLDTIPLEEELNMIRTNIIAPHILTKWFIKEKDYGFILNVASMAGFQPGPLMTTYGGTKSYLLNFSLAANYELKKRHKNIHITTLCPGPVDTEFNKVADADFNISSITAKLCAKEAVRGLFQKKELVVPGRSMKLIRIGSKLAPLRIILPMEYKIQGKKTRNTRL